MRPILMIEGLRNLHDARYCAAVGISMASFCMESDSRDALAPGVVKEITEWLSGLEVIGSLGHDTEASILEKAEAAGLKWVMVSADYDVQNLEKTGLRIVLDASAGRSDDSLVAHLTSISDRFPAALFLVAMDQDVPDSLRNFSNHKDLLAKCILRYDDPNEIYRQLKRQDLHPYGFSLGAFASDEGGNLDYDACDAFIQVYHELIPV